MKKILIILTSQFGYHTDTYMYCKYLDKSKYEVHYVGFDSELPTRELEGVHIHTLAVLANKILRYWYYIKAINTLIRKEKYEALFYVDGQATLLIRLCNLFRTSILDIRTGDVWMKSKNNSVYDTKTRLTALFFKRISIISINLARKMNIPTHKCHYLPLGGDSLSTHALNIDQLHLFYIGIIHGRNIDETVKAISIFKIANPLIPIKYDIVGYGTPTEEAELNNCIKQLQLEVEVKFHGRKNHDEIMHFIKGANVGVVYIPMTYGFDCQPTTKLYEYLLTGMPVIATNTLENKLALTHEAGVLIDDNPVAFAQGLEKIWEQRANFRPDLLKKHYAEYTWENIVKHNLEPYLDEILAS